MNCFQHYFLPGQIPWECRGKVILPDVYFNIEPSLHSTATEAVSTLADNRRTLSTDKTFLQIEILEVEILYLKFKLSNQKTLSVPRDNVVFKLSVWFLNLSDATPRESYTHRLKTLKNGLDKIKKSKKHAYKINLQIFCFVFIVNFGQQYFTDNISSVFK